MNTNILKEIVAYTTSVDLELVKVTGNGVETTLEAMTTDKSLVLQAKFKQPLAEFTGTVGLPNLARLNTILSIPEYRENAQVTGTVRSTGELETIVFNNQQGDFTNVYRLMSSEMVNNLVPSAKFKEPSWNLEFQPLAVNIQKFRYQTQALSDSAQFQTYVKNHNLYFEMGEVSSHQGSFVFHSPVAGQLAGRISWPVKQVLAILNLVGDKTLKISDAGAMQITVDSGVAEYRYIVPAQKK
jgi:hypothetical protein